MNAATTLKPTYGKTLRRGDKFTIKAFQTGAPVFEVRALDSRRQKVYYWYEGKRYMIKYTDVIWKVLEGGKA